ncbi:MAG: shikimate kinase [Candidatus Heimdallarchaeota archaeon]
MIGRAVSHGAISIVAAFATGIGGAVGIDLKTEVIVRLSNNPGTITTQIQNVSNVNGDLIRICVLKVLEACHKNDTHGASISTKSEIPIARGLKSSSSAANAAVLATYAALLENPLIDDLVAVKIGVDAALEAGVSITGAFDDACACYFGGAVITNNYKRKIVRNPHINPRLKVVLRIPSSTISTRDSGAEGLRELNTFFEMTVQEALKGSIFNAMMMNGLLCASYYGMDASFLTDMVRTGALTAGVSGTGPTMFAITKEERVAQVSNQAKGYGDEVKVVDLNFEKTRAWRSS